jgi:hypothetical protein
LWNGHDVTVVDICEDAACLLHRRNNSRISTRCTDFLAQTFDGHFDVVMGIESIQYFTSVTLEALVRQDPTGLNSRGWRYALHRLRGSKGIQYNMAGPNDYQTALRKAGFEVLSMEGLVWMPFTVSSNSRLVPLFGSIERALHLNRWIGQSPWLLVAAQRVRETESPALASEDVV